jgi:hypothetical protein
MKNSWNCEIQNNNNNSSNESIIAIQSDDFQEDETSELLSSTKTNDKIDIYRRFNYLIKSQNQAQNQTDVSISITTTLNHKSKKQSTSPELLTEPRAASVAENKQKNNSNSDNNNNNSGTFLNSRKHSLDKYTQSGLSLSQPLLSTNQNFIEMEKEDENEKNMEKKEKFDFFSKADSHFSRNFEITGLSPGIDHFKYPPNILRNQKYYPSTFVFVILYNQVK